MIMIMIETGMKMMPVMVHLKVKGFRRIKSPPPGKLKPEKGKSNKPWTGYSPSRPSKEG